MADINIFKKVSWLHNICSQISCKTQFNTPATTTSCPCSDLRWDVPADWRGPWNDLPDWPADCFCFAPVKPVKVCKMPHVCPGSMVMILLPNHPPATVPPLHNVSLGTFLGKKRPTKPTFYSPKYVENLKSWVSKHPKAPRQNTRTAWVESSGWAARSPSPPGHNLDPHSEEVVLVAASTRHAWWVQGKGAYKGRLVGS